MSSPSQAVSNHDDMQTQVFGNYTIDHDRYCLPAPSTLHPELQFYESLDNEILLVDDPTDWDVTQRSLQQAAHTGVGIICFRRAIFNTQSNPVQERLDCVYVRGLYVEGNDPVSLVNTICLPYLATLSLVIDPLPDFPGERPTNYWGDLEIFLYACRSHRPDMGSSIKRVEIYDQEMSDEDLAFLLSSRFLRLVPTVWISGFKNPMRRLDAIFQSSNFFSEVCESKVSRNIDVWYRRNKRSKFSEDSLYSPKSKAPVYPDGDEVYDSGVHQTFVGWTNSQEWDARSYVKLRHYDMGKTKFLQGLGREHIVANAIDYWLRKNMMIERQYARKSRLSSVDEVDY